MYLPFYFLDKWIALLHHGCDEHKWLGRECSHKDGDHDETFHGLTVMTRISYKSR